MSANETKHTAKWPTPWVHDIEGMTVRGLVRDANGLRVVFIPYGPEGAVDDSPVTCETLEERTALAERIVAAVNSAPDLLASLKACIQWIEDGPPGDCQCDASVNYECQRCGRLAVARAAVAKAGGDV